MKSLHGTIYYILLEQPQICSHLLESIFTQIILCIFSQKFANFEAFKVSTYLFIHREKFFTNLDIIGCYCSVFFDCLETCFALSLGDSMSMWYQQELLARSQLLLLLGLFSISFHSCIPNEAVAACTNNASVLNICLRLLAFA
jgi:hypothetical protein